MPDLDTSYLDISKMEIVYDFPNISFDTSKSQEPSLTDSILDDGDSVQLSGAIEITDNIGRMMVENGTNHAPDDLNSFHIVPHLEMEEHESMQDDDPLITGNQNNLINVGELNTEEPNIEDQVVEVIAEPQIDNNRAEVVDETPSITDDSSSSGSDFEEIDSSGRPKKGRKRKYAHQSRDIRKKRKNSNKKYISQTGKVVYPKNFRDFHCACKCNEKVSLEVRKSTFKKFYDLGDYNAQNMFICASVQEEKTKRPTVQLSKRQFTRKYTINNTVICRNMYVQTLRVSTKRINTALKKLKNDNVKDERGKCGGSNKIEDKRIEEVRNHIKRIPAYKSHYCRTTTESCWLPPDMTLPRMYSLYKAEVEHPVSQSKYNQIFYADFNLKRKPLQKDTCSTCDTLHALENSTTSDIERDEIKIKHEAHLKLVEEVRAQFKDDLLTAKTVESKQTLSFDLQKTLPLPRLPTNVIYYKRQIMLYNLGIHSGKTGKGHFNVWLENTAGRGTQEVGSCLKRHILENCPGIKELTLWSDSCGGQNRSIKIVLLLKHVLSLHPTLENIVLRYMIPGHSYLPNDAEFGDVECHLKTQQRMYTDSDYISVMENCRRKNKFIVTRMEKEDFFSTSDLEKKITNRKEDVDGIKVGWLKFREIEIFKDKPFSIFVRTSLGGLQQEIDIKKKKKVGANTCYLRLAENLPLLWPNGKGISLPKLKDLKSIMSLIPSDAKEFYKQFSSDTNVQDDIDGFNANLDFELEAEENIN
ncbi:uncharacterized protein LOC124356846 [Homalodisca vitripennis]|nr:uncharacterized protein LOC124356846 [Homalodisca vitripennis]